MGVMKLKEFTIDLKKQDCYEHYTKRELLVYNTEVRCAVL